MRSLVVCLVGTVIAATAGASASAAVADELPAVTVKTSGPASARPGPDILYSAADSPLLRNERPWTAEPIMVSGTSAYRDGEFLYQDYLYDDHGAGGTRTYPNDPELVDNAADFVELRLKLVGSATAVRITYNSMIDPQRVATTIALGGSPEPRQMPHGANTVAPAQVFVTVHGTSGTIIDAATGQPLAEEPAVSVSLQRRQVDVRIPEAAYDPGRGTVRVAAATGLWDAATDRYLTPSATTSAFFNVAFRYDESGTWNDSHQSARLTARDISAFHADVDFAKLRAGVTDDMADKPGGVPRTGYMQRIGASQFETQQGRGLASATCEQPCDRIPEYAGQLQPYSLYVPTTPPPATGYGLVYRPHSCGSNYMSNVGRRGQTDLIGETTGSLVFVPNGRGACLWYWGQSGADMFEVAGDVMRRYPVDPTYVSITGISMGGYGTYKASALWPDLFARAATIVGCTSAEVRWPGPGTPPASGEAAVVHHMAASWRHVPLLSMNGAADATCTTTSQHTLLKKLDGLGYRYEWRDYPGEHIGGIAAAGLLDPNAVANFLDQRRVVRDPAHVTYVYNLKASETRYGLNADHVYWVSGLKLADEGGSLPLGTIDVRSRGFGVGDPPPRTTQPISGTGYAGLRKEWGAPPRAPVENVLDIKAENISAVTIDVRRAAVDCDVTLNVVSDVPLTVTLAGCAREVAEPPLAAYYNNVGIQRDPTVRNANLDGNGFSYSGEALAAGDPARDYPGVEPGGKISANGFDFTWPASAPGTPDNVQNAGQTVPVGSSPGATKIGFLGAATGGTASGTFTFHYSYTDSDGVVRHTSMPTRLTFPDWARGFPGETPLPPNTAVAVRSLFRSAPPWPAMSVYPAHVYLITAPLEPGMRLDSVTLPVGSGAIHLFGADTH